MEQHIKQESETALFISKNNVMIEEQPEDPVAGSCDCHQNADEPSSWSTILAEGLLRILEVSPKVKKSFTLLLVSSFGNTCVMSG